MSATTARPEDTGSRLVRVLIGLATLGLGVAVLVWPDRTVRLVALLIGIALILAGAERIVGALFAHDEEAGSRLAMLVLGGLTLVVGVFFVRNLTRSLELIVVLTGLVYILGGLFELFAAVAIARANRGFAAALGAVTLIVGIVLVAWPNPTLTFFAVVIGLYFVVRGSAEIVRALLRPREPSTMTVSVEV
jgi:uncharacterized membrane protein HdeD (DUF308 family)